MLEHDKKPKVDFLQILGIIAFLMRVSKLLQYEINSMGVGKKKYRIEPIHNILNIIFYR